MSYKNASGGTSYAGDVVAQRDRQIKNRAALVGDVNCACIFVVELHVGFKRVAANGRTAAEHPVIGSPEGKNGGFLERIATARPTRGLAPVDHVHCSVVRGPAQLKVGCRKSHVASPFAGAVNTDHGSGAAANAVAHVDGLGGGAQLLEIQKIERTGKTQPTDSDGFAAGQGDSASGCAIPLLTERNVTVVACAFKHHIAVKEQTASATVGGYDVVAGSGKVAEREVAVKGNVNVAAAGGDGQATGPRGRDAAVFNGDIAVKYCPAANDEPCARLHHKRMRCASSRLGQIVQDQVPIVEVAEREGFAAGQGLGDIGTSRIGAELGAAALGTIAFQYDVSIECAFARGRVV